MRFLTRMVLAVAFASIGCGDSDRSEVDETGYLQPDMIFYSSAGALGADDASVFVVGTQGAIEVTGGSLSWILERTGETGSQTLDVASFAIPVQARLGDTLTLRYSVDDVRGEWAVSLEDTLDAVEDPQICPLCSGRVVSAGDEPGTAEVNLGLLEPETPPFVVTNTSGGPSVLVTEVGSVVIAAQQADMICVFRLSDDRAQSSATYCESVP